MVEQEAELKILQCRVLTPRRVVAEKSIANVAVHGLHGSIEVFPGHEPLMVPLAIGVATLTDVEGGVQRLALHGGFLDTDGERVSILADAAEDQSEIDVDRAQQALDRAKERLAKVSTSRADDVEIDIDRAKLAILRATMRIRAVREPSEE